MIGKSVRAVHFGKRALKEILMKKVKFATALLIGLLALALHGKAPQDNHKPRLEFRLVANDNEPAADEFSDGQEKLRVLRDVVLDDSAIQSAQAKREKNIYAVSLTMTQEGAQRLKKATGDNIGRRLAIIFDGKIISAPTIRSAIGEKAMITGGAGKFSKEEADAMVAAIEKSKQGQDAKNESAK
jgi:preprotein translocase subunit SecD